MSKLVIIGLIETASGERNRVLDALAAHKARCLRDEPGSLKFEIMIPHDDDNRVLLYEVYRDDAAFEVHRNSPSIAQFREETDGMIVDLRVTKCAFLG